AAAPWTGSPCGSSDVAVFVQARGDAALFLAQRGAFSGLGVEHAAPDLGAAVTEQAADLALRQPVALVADHAVVARVAVDRWIRVPGWTRARWRRRWCGLAAGGRGQAGAGRGAHSRRGDSGGPPFGAAARPRRH